MKQVGTPGLSLIFLVVLGSWLMIQAFGVHEVPHPQDEVMHRAEDRLRAAFSVVDSVKRARSLPIDDTSPVPWRALLGEDYTPMTTTLGSLTAKEAATNPAWAGLMVRLLFEAGVSEGDTVGVMASGSFPTLALATLSALEEMGVEPKLIVSLGASSFGANSRLGTWLDIEEWVGSAGLIDARSLLVTLGAENDVGDGMADEGVQWLHQALARHGREAFRAESLTEAVAVRVELLGLDSVSAVVNIGGGQASLGRCVHTATLPAGRWPDDAGCRCRPGGALMRFHDHQIPIINLSHIRQLALLYGLDPEPGASYRNTGAIDAVTKVDAPWVLAALVLAVSVLAWVRWGSDR